MAGEVTFTGRLQRLDKGMKRHVIFIPQQVVEELGLVANTRTEGTLNGVPIRLAALSNGDGTYYLSIGPHLRRDAKLKLRQEAPIKIKLAPNPDAVILPEELEAALDTDPDAQAVFDTFTPGLQRSYAYHVDSAKRIDTRIKRALDLCEKMKTGQLHSQKK